MDTDKLIFRNGKWYDKETSKRVIYNEPPTEVVTIDEVVEDDTLIDLLPDPPKRVGRPPKQKQ